MLRLYKKQKLCSATAIDALFGAPGASSASSQGVSASLAYPLRAVWRSNPRRGSDAPLQFLISVPKRRLRHAVDRVLARRRIREAFRLHHQDFPLPAGARLDVAFVYVGRDGAAVEPYERMRAAMCRLLRRIADSTVESAAAETARAVTAHPDTAATDAGSSASETHGTPAQDVQ